MEVIQIKKFFFTTKDLPIWFFLNKEIFECQNSYGYTMVCRGGGGGKIKKLLQIG